MTDIWEGIKKEIRGSLPEKSFSLWIGPVNLVETKDDTLVLGCPNKFSLNGSTENYIGIIREKIKLIGRMDQMRGHLAGRLPQGVVVAITADHSTPCVLKDHSGDPVPLTVFGEGVRVDEVPHFDERSAARGSLGRLQGKDLMPMLLNAANRAEKFGA